MEPEAWEINAAGRRRVGVAELWDARELVGFLAWRDLKVRYKQAVLGVAWAVLQPLIAVALFTFVFRRLVEVPSDGLPYPVFALAGYLLWTYVANATNLSRTSLVGNAALITRVYFPRLALPTAALAPPLVELAVGTVVLFAFAVGSGVRIGPQVLFAPLFLLFAALLSAGVGTFAGSLSVRYRDVQQVFGFVMQLWLFASPVLYPSDLVAERWRWLYHLNPMVGIVDGWRWATIGGSAPGARSAVSLAVTTMVLVAGVATFRHLERTFADVV